MSKYMPPLALTEHEGQVRLSLAGVAAAEGSCLQEAGDELVRRLLVMAMTVRADAARWSAAFRPEPGLLELLWRVGQVAASGGDIRDLIFGPGADPD